MNIGTVLSCSPHIVENIFQHLTAKDLGSCASVCNLWAVESQEEIQRRGGIVPFFQGIKCGKHRHIHKHYQECSMRQASKFESQLKAQLENVSIKPAFCIAFATTGFLEHFEKLFSTYFASKRPRKRLKRCYLDYFDTAVKIALKKHLPPTCCISLYIEDNITFYGKNVQSNLIEMDAPALCGYLFPKLPDGELKFYRRKENSGQILKNIIRNGQNIKSTLNLVEYSSLPYFQIALNELRHRHNAFECGIIMPVRMASNYVPVFEGPNVQVSRFAIGSYISTLEDNSLNEFMNQWKNEMKEKKKLKDNTIAFMFSVDHDNCFKVCEVFKIVYPDVPLAGLFKCTHSISLGISKARDYLDNLVKQSVRDSGLRCYCVFIFVTFNA